MKDVVEILTSFYYFIEKIYVFVLKKKKKLGKTAYGSFFSKKNGKMWFLLTLLITEFQDSRAIVLVSKMFP